MHDTPVRRRYDKEEFARRGDAAYEQIRPLLKPEDHGKFAAIDIDSGLYEVDADELTACQRLRARAPQSQTWVVRIGYQSTRRFGGRE